MVGGGWLALAILVATPALALPDVAVDTFLPDGSLSPGRAVISSVPDPDTIPGIVGEIPGRGYAFAIDAPGFVVSRIEIGLSYISGSRDVIASIHDSVFSDIAFTGVERTLPGAVLASADLSDVLVETASIVAWELEAPLLLEGGTEYFLAVTTDPLDEPSQLGWNHSDTSDTGFQRVAQTPDRSWIGYAYHTPPRGAFRVQGFIVPEPSTNLLSLLGLVLLALARRGCSLLAPCQTTPAP